jgi:ubiquinone biosynthesis accessory factor UbiK
MDTKFFDELSKRLSKVLPEGVRDFEHDLQAKFREILQATFAKLDLVTREEFDTQVKVLERTRKKLDLLEKEWAELKPKKPRTTRKTSAKK